MADWLMVIITAIYVVATIAICHYNGKSAKAAQEQTEMSRQQIGEMIKQYNEANRPRVVIYFEIIRSGLLCFVIENVGTAAASDVQIHVNDAFLTNLENEGQGERLREICGTKLFMASRQKFFILVGGQSKFKAIAKEVAKFKISYYMNDQKYEECTNIDLWQYRFMLVYNSELGDIAQYMKKLQEDNRRFQKDQLKEMKHNTPLSVLVYNVDDSTKFKLFKAVCSNPGSNAEELANTVGCTKEVALEGLVELDDVDRLITWPFPDEDEYKVRWYRR